MGFAKQQVVAGRVGPNAYAKQNFQQNHRLGMEDILRIGQRCAELTNTVKKQQEAILHLNRVLGTAEPTLRLLTVSWMLGF